MGISNRRGKHPLGSIQFLTLPGGMTDDDSLDHSHLVARGCLSSMALQPELGILPQRWSGFNCFDSDHSAVNARGLKMHSDTLGYGAGDGDRTRNQRLGKPL